MPFDDIKGSSANAMYIYILPLAFSWASVSLILKPLLVKSTKKSDDVSSAALELGCKEPSTGLYGFALLLSTRNQPSSLRSSKLHKLTHLH